MSRRWVTKISDSNSTTTPLGGGLPTGVPFQGEANAISDGPSLTILRPPGVVTNDVMLAAIAANQNTTTDLVPFRGASSIAHGNPGPGGGISLTIPKPVGVVLGDVMVACITLGGSSPAITAPLGWIPIRSDAIGDGPVHVIQQALLYKIAGPAEPVDYTFTAPLIFDATGIIVAYFNINLVTPVNADSGSAVVVSGGVTSITAPSVSPTVNNTVLLGFYGINPPGGATTTPAMTIAAPIVAVPPGVMVERAEVFVTGSQAAVDGPVSAGTNRVLISEVADQRRSTIISTGSRTATVTGATGVGSWITVGQLVALEITPVVNVIVPPVGWTLVNSQTGNGMTQNIYSKVAGTTEPVNYTWTGQTDMNWTGIISAYFSISTVTPVNASGGLAFADTVANTITAPSVTTSVANTVLACFFAGEPNVGINAIAEIDPPVGMTERAESSNPQVGPVLAIINEVADLRLTSAGATFDRTATLTNFAGSKNVIGQTVALEIVSSPSSFNGISEEVIDYQSLRIWAYTDEESSSTGLEVLWSTDNVNFDEPTPDRFAVLADTVRSEIIPVRARFMRIRYTNGATAQTFFRLQTTLGPESDQPFSRVPEKFTMRSALNVSIATGIATTIVSVPTSSAGRFVEVIGYGATRNVDTAPALSTAFEYQVTLQIGSILDGQVHRFIVRSDEDEWQPLRIFTNGQDLTVQIRHDQVAARSFDGFLLLREL